MQDRPGRQGSGRGYRRQDSFAEPSEGNGSDRRQGFRERSSYNDRGRGRGTGQRRPYNDDRPSNGQRGQQGDRPGERPQQTGPRAYSNGRAEGDRNEDAKDPAQSPATSLTASQASAAAAAPPRPQAPEAAAATDALSATAQPASQAPESAAPAAGAAPQQPTLQAADAAAAPGSLSAPPRPAARSTDGARPESRPQQPAQARQGTPQAVRQDSGQEQSTSAAAAPALAPSPGPARPQAPAGAGNGAPPADEAPKLLSAKPQLSRAPTRGGVRGGRGQQVDPNSIPAGGRRQETGRQESGNGQERPQRREPQGRVEGATGPRTAAAAPGGQRTEYVPVRDTGDDRVGRGQGGRGGGRDFQVTDHFGARRNPASRWMQRADEGKVDISTRRSSRAQRRMDRADARRDAAPVREDIFEIGNEGLSVTELSQKLALPTGEVVKTLFMQGIMVQVNQVLDKDTVKLVAKEYEVEVIDKEEAGIDTMAKKTVDYLEDEDVELLQPRPPIVTVMGHVDHGKTSLLDYVRKTKVAFGEAGGITQAIGAYTVDVPAESGAKHITFLDTPGHEAFSAMRARGTKVTDIAIVVVAADDGVRPQTLEAISHAKAAGVPILVAINKIDKEGANIDRVKQEMSENGLLPEEWGGETPMVAISAKKGDGVDDLLETVLLMAEVEELLANPDRPARGTIVESHLDKKTGAVATMLVAAGTLRQGDVVQAGAAFGKVRTMRESKGEVTEAGPSIAVQMVGLNAVPVAGDEFSVCSTEQEARKNAEAVELAMRLDRLQAQAGASMVTTNTLASMDEDESDAALKRFNIILKADATGALEAVKAAINALPQDRVQPRFLLAAASDITKSDVDLAFASDGIILGFNIEPSEAALAHAKQYGVDMRSYRVIYDIVDDIRAMMEGKLAAVEERMPLGEAEVRAIFGSGSRIVAGCMVTEGQVRKGCHAVIMRNKQKVHEGKVTSLRRVKDDVKEVSAGLECGLAVETYLGWREGDRIELCEIKSKQQTLEEASPVPAPAAVPAGV
ncbi:hypothetical protein CVIRNUC_009614 [Coccomyxa viridis]|uniref:Translation initiation factor IF-2, chloroplastic n=1 Tax=Coccomyxa viridis TaxID=1274662 RepID=A0AAV1IHX7_9CHLO|nr:hypothetical protein CVIRNUC_009614 [Coccomyxa viridis]